MALTLAEQRKLPGFEVLKNAGIFIATPYGSRPYANKMSPHLLTLDCQNGPNRILYFRCLNLRVLYKRSELSMNGPWMGT